MNSSKSHYKNNKTRRQIVTCGFGRRIPQSRYGAGYCLVVRDLVLTLFAILPANIARKVIQEDRWSPGPTPTILPDARDTPLRARAVLASVRLV